MRSLRATSSLLSCMTRMRPMHGAVRDALRLGPPLIATGLTLGAAPIACAAHFPPVFPLASLLPTRGGDGSEGFVLQGAALDDSGHAVSGAGDVNGDGIDDLQIGAPGGAQGYGAVYVVFGHSTGFPAAFDLASLWPPTGDGSLGFVLRGSTRVEAVGFSVNEAGDVNADGIDDLVVASPSAQDGAGRSYVVFGRAGGFPAQFDLSRLAPQNGGDGTEGFVLVGEGENDGAGTSVSSAGDVNGDGVDDLIIGAPEANPNGRDGAGESYVVFGRPANTR